MSIRRFVARGIAGALALGLGALLLFPVVAVVAAVVVPILVYVAAVGAVATLVMAIAGIPALIALLLAVVAVALGFTLLAGVIGGLKLVLFGLMLFWLARALFGWTGAPRRRERVLVGHPVSDVPPSRPRDRYEVEAERDLDRELGF